MRLLLMARYRVIVEFDDYEWDADSLRSDVEASFTPALGAFKVWNVVPLDPVDPELVEVVVDVVREESKRLGVEIEDLK